MPNSSIRKVAIRIPGAGLTNYGDTRTDAMRKMQSLVSASESAIGKLFADEGALDYQRNIASILREQGEDLGHMVASASIGSEKTDIACV